MTEEQRDDYVLNQGVKKLVQMDEDFKPGGSDNAESDRIKLNLVESSPTWLRQRSCQLAGSEMLLIIPS